MRGVRIEAEGSSSWVVLFDFLSQTEEMERRIYLNTQTTRQGGGIVCDGWDG